MAFPGTYDITYYKGDTHEFNIYPKDSSGNLFDLALYTGSAELVISAKRGVLGATDPEPVLARAIVSGDHLECAIRPADGLLLDSTIQYVYEVSISHDEQPYSKKYTLLTGSLTVKDRVAQ